MLRVREWTRIRGSLLKHKVVTILLMLAQFAKNVP